MKNTFVAIVLIATGADAKKSEPRPLSSVLAVCGAEIQNMCQMSTEYDVTGKDGPKKEECRGLIKETCSTCFDGVSEGEHPDKECMKSCVESNSILAGCDIGPPNKHGGKHGDKHDREGEHEPNKNGEKHSDKHGDMHERDGERDGEDDPMKTEVCRGLIKETCSTCFEGMTEGEHPDKDCMKTCFESNAAILADSGCDIGPPNKHGDKHDGERDGKHGLKKECRNLIKETCSTCFEGVTEDHHPDKDCMKTCFETNAAILADAGCDLGPPKRNGGHRRLKGGGKGSGKGGGKGGKSSAKGSSKKAKRTEHFAELRQCIKENKASLSETCRASIQSAVPAMALDANHEELSDVELAGFFDAVAEEQATLDDEEETHGRGGRGGKKWLAAGAGVGFLALAVVGGVMWRRRRRRAAAASAVDEEGEPNVYARMCACGAAPPTPVAAAPIKLESPREVAMATMVGVV